MDGNARWAQLNGLKTVDGHIAGAKAVARLIKAIEHTPIPFLTLYAFSTENFNRGELEVTSILNVIGQFLIDDILPLALIHGYRVTFLGNFDMLPKYICDICNTIIQKTHLNANCTIAIALGYGGRQEIVSAVNVAIDRKRLTNDLSPVSYEELRAALYDPSIPDPELVVRYGGKCRLSNFMPIQTAYSDFIFTNKLWPDFEDADLNEFLSDYSKITVTHGGRNA
jgi:undecaprenyl diphosphate synthase